MTSFSNSCLVTALLSFIFGIFVWIRGRRRSDNLHWSHFCVSVAFWSAGLGMMVRSQSASEAFTWLRFVHYVGAIMIPITFFHFATIFLNLNRQKFIVVGYWLAAIQQVLSFSGVLATVKPLPPFNFYTVPYPSYILFTGYFFFYVAYGHWLLWRRMRSSHGQLRNQLLYIFVGTSIGFCGGTTAFLPVFHLPVFPYGVYGVVVYIFSVSYAILKHRLMDISVIVRKTLIYSTVMGTLTIMYLAVIALFAHMFEGITGYQTVFSSAIAACLITLGFQPLRKKIQGFVDGKFFRQYVDREEKLYELSREVVTHTTPEQMGEALMRVLQDTLHPKSGALYLKSKFGSGYSRYALTGSDQMPVEIEGDNSLVRYFQDHPQPFVQDLPTSVGESQSTRAERSRGTAA